MKVLLTGGSGNLGQTLLPKLLNKGDTPVTLDVRAPAPLNEGAVFIKGSVLDCSKLTKIFRGCNCIVHIAAWHGIHEDRGEKDAYDFFDLNVRGIFEVFEAAASAGIGKVIFISRTGGGALLAGPHPHIGTFPQLEDQMTNFTSDIDRA